MDYLHNFLFGIYPYIALAVFLLGSLIRFDREQYTWKSDSSQLLHRGALRIGSPLFHVGILGVFFGHLVGLLTPHALYAPFMAAETKQLIAMGAGGVMGGVALIGLLILLVRRFGNERLLAVTPMRDRILLPWLLFTLLLGLSTIFASSHHMDGSVMLLLCDWAQAIVTFDSSAAGYIRGVSLAYKLHIFFGMTFFLIFPFTRMVHVWSGFGSVGYLGRAWQLVRTR